MAAAPVDGDQGGAHRPAFREQDIVRPAGSARVHRFDADAGVAQAISQRRSGQDEIAPSAE